MKRRSSEQNVSSDSARSDAASNNKAPSGPLGILYKIGRILSGWFLLLVILFSSLIINALQVIVYMCLFLPYTKRIALAQELANQWFVLIFLVNRGCAAAHC